MERVALGYLRLTLEEYEACTPRELQWRYEAEVGREDREFERIAQLACWVLNPWMQGGRPLTVRQLLKRGGGRKSEEWWNE